VLVLMVVVLGGMGFNFGVIVGVVVISVLFEMFCGVVDYCFFVFGVLLIVMMIFWL